jgi:tRNA pseudouridine(54/55) synthase
VNKFSDAEIDELSTNASSMSSIFDSFQHSGCTWKTSIRRCPSYILGRYLKLARDVPQSRWMIGEERKGRASVEEIISEAICEVLDSKTACKLHGCGREDIDVRCLGSGRPFIVEVSDYRHDITKERLSSIVELINSNHGLNSCSDITVAWMERV